MLTLMKIYGSRTAAQVLPVGSGGIDSDPIQIKKVNGLGPVQAEVTTTQYGAANGERLADSFVGKRNIVIDFALNPDWATQTVEELRSILYSYFMTQQIVKLEFQGTTFPDVAITGIVESIEPNIFARDPEVQVSVLCPMPNFVAVEPTIIEGLVSDESPGVVISPTDIEYEGNVDCGFVLKIFKDPSEPDMDSWMNLFTASPVPETFRFLGVVDGTNYYKISTKLGQKYVHTVNISTGVITNELGWVDATSSWPKLYPGLNSFQVESSNGNHPWELTYFAEFGGL